MCRRVHVVKLVTVTRRAAVAVAPAAVAIIMAVIVTSGTAILPVIPVPVFAAMVIAGTPVVAPLSIIVALVVTLAVAVAVAVKGMFFSIASVTAAVGVGALEVVIVTKAALLVRSGVLHLKNRLVPRRRRP